MKQQRPYKELLSKAGKIMFNPKRRETVLNTFRLSNPSILNREQQEIFLDYLENLARIYDERTRKNNTSPVIPYLSMGAGIIITGSLSLGVFSGALTYISGELTLRYYQEHLQLKKRRESTLQQIVRHSNQTHPQDSVATHAGEHEPPIALPPSYYS